MTLETSTVRSAPRRTSRAAWAVWSCAALTAVWQVWALCRFYRRFLYDAPTGRIWGLADDVYISACFGRSLVEGEGFLWFAGAPRVEGISNPLWSVILGLLHLLPGFSEDRLGAYVALTNIALLTLTCVLFFRTLCACSATAGPGATSLRTCLAVALAACGVSLAYWSAEGFEVALIATLALAMMQSSLVGNTRRSEFGFGLCFVAGMATRMDFMLVAIAPVLVAFTQAQYRRRRLLTFAATTFVGIASLLIARKLYYDDWLPNTYYLKATQWPLAARVERGLRQDAVLVPIVALVWLPLLLPAVRKRLGRSAMPVAAGFLAFSLTVAYSVFVGGDAWGLYGGYDRHAVVGGIFLTWGLSVFVVALDVSRSVRLLAFVWSLGLAAWPVFGGSSERVRAGLWNEPSPMRNFERDWIRYGKSLEQLSHPGARAAVCPAGAIVYFSHRGGVDLLGKVEPYVAHLPVSFRTPKGSHCWQNAPGHNKEDDVQVFALRMPEFSRYLPPKNVRARYVKVRYKDKDFYILRDSPLARWDSIPSRTIVDAR